MHACMHACMQGHTARTGLQAVCRSDLHCALGAAVAKRQAPKRGGGVSLERELKRSAHPHNLTGPTESACPFPQVAVPLYLLSAGPSASNHPGPNHLFHTLKRSTVCVVLSPYTAPRGGPTSSSACVQ
eukprot:278984-Chlamydomonas_euryale.AAC.4